MKPKQHNHNLPRYNPIINKVRHLHNIDNEIIMQPDQGGEYCNYQETLNLLQEKQNEIDKLQQRNSELNNQTQNIDKGVRSNNTCEESTNNINKILFTSPYNELANYISDIAENTIRVLIQNETSVGRLQDHTKRSFIFFKDIESFLISYPKNISSESHIEIAENIINSLLQEKPSSEKLLNKTNEPFIFI